MSEENKEQEEAIQKLFAFVVESKSAGKSDEFIKEELVNQVKIEPEAADNLIATVNKAIKEKQYEARREYEKADDEDSGMGWLVWIGILVIVNVLSAIFDWPFWIY